MQRLFKNRFHAGHLLARRLVAYAAHPDVLVLALPRGGVRRKTSVKLISDNGVPRLRPEKTTSP